MVGQNLEAFEHWKNLFILLTKAKDGVEIESEENSMTQAETEARKILSHRKLSDGQYF